MNISDGYVLCDDGKTLVHDDSRPSRNISEDYALCFEEAFEDEEDSDRPTDAHAHVHFMPEVATAGEYVRRAKEPIDNDNAPRLVTRMLVLGVLFCAGWSAFRRG